MNAKMDIVWQLEFRKRMEDFRRAKPDVPLPVSIKVRPVSGCFNRPYSPHAFKLIDRYLAGADLSGVPCQFEKHESGPELLVGLNAATAGLTFPPSVVELIAAIIRARSEGIQNGDWPAEPLALIVRGYSRNGEFFEKAVLRIPPQSVVTTRQIEDALASFRR